MFSNELVIQLAYLIRFCLIIFRYGDEEEQITQYQRIFLEDIEKIEIGNNLNF